MKIQPTSRLSMMLLLSTAAVASKADITALSLNGHAYVDCFQQDPFTGNGNFYSNEETAPVLAFNDPPTYNSIGDAQSVTALSALSSVLDNSATSFHLQSDIRTNLDVFGQDRYSEASAHAYQEIFFTVDNTATVTLSRLDLGNTTTGTFTENSYIYLDGTYYLFGSPASGTFSVNVGAGSHYAYYEDVSFVQAGSFGSFGPQSGVHLNSLYDFQIAPTPEPASVAAVGIGLLALHRRKLTA